MQDIDANAILSIGSLIVMALMIIVEILKRFIKIKLKFNVTLFVAMFLIFFLSFMLVPGYRPARAAGRLTHCESNTKIMGTALEFYATDNGGYYPESLDMLTPNYLTTFPRCPSSDLTYGLAVGKNPDAFTVYCSGKDAHKKVGLKTGFPQYSSEKGLITE